MHFKRLGSSSVQLPEIGNGTWNYTAGQQPLQAAMDHGTCLIDTAESYGTEELVGQAVRDRRTRAFVATKAAPRNFRGKDLIAAAERSLLRLGTDYIDLYQLHWPNYTVPIEETMAAMEELVQAGKIRFIGVSNFSLRELKQAQASLSKNRIVSNQLRYSLIERTIETDLLPYCQTNQITVIAFSPLGKGLSQIRACDPAGVLGELTSMYDRTEAQLALNWVIAKPNVVAIPKASTVAHVAENCGASGWRLSQTDSSRLEKGIRFRRRGPLEAAGRRGAKHILQLFGRHL
jgi:diketogulonate reductase-like aldo/keto reductase